LVRPGTASEGIHDTPVTDDSMRILLLHRLRTQPAVIAR
jgi:hypothetical protein